jgi:hypothetical protein
VPPPLDCPLSGDRGASPLARPAVEMGGASPAACIAGIAPRDGEVLAGTAASPLAKRIVVSWIATDVICASLFIRVLNREET